MIWFARSVMSVVIVVFSIACPCSSYPSARVHVCERSSITISADEPVNQQDFCGAAEDALAFFDRLDLQLTHPLVIEIAPELPDWMSDTAVGCYQEEERKIFVLTFPAFEKRGDWFGVPVNQLMYRSLVTHEVAHAVASCNFTISQPTIHAGEYAAYVAMFVMMNPDLRARVLVAYPGAAFDSELEINEITYSFDPMHFGVAAYRHYLKNKHGDVFLRKVLSGDALTNTVNDLP